MLSLLTILIVLAVAYAHAREGLLTALTMLCNVCIAGVMAFYLGGAMAAGLVRAIPACEGYEDALCLLAVFSMTLGIIRWICGKMAPTQTELPAVMQQTGAAVCGGMTGYLVAGFLTVVMQTLPVSENFLTFDHRVDGPNSARRYLPPDRVWLALLQRASEIPLARDDGRTFDADGSYEQTFARFRRYKD